MKLFVLGMAIIASSAFAKLSDLELREQTPQRFFVIKTTTEGTSEAVSKAMGKILPFVLEYIQHSGHQPASAPMGRFYGAPEETVTFEAGFAVGNDIEPPCGCSEIEEVNVPATQTVTVTHTGPYSGLGEAYGAIHAWMEDNGYENNGLPVEYYVNDPGEVAPEDIQTEIHYPVKK